jgi:hypothetical protein
LTAVKPNEYSIETRRRIKLGVEISIDEDDVERQRPGSKGHLWQ